MDEASLSELIFVQNELSAIRKPVEIHPSEADLELVGAANHGAASAGGVAPIERATASVGSLDPLEARRMVEAFLKAAGVAPSDVVLDRMQAAFRKARPGTTPESIGVFFGLEHS